MRMKIKWQFSIAIIILCLTMILLTNYITTSRLRDDIEQEHNETIERTTGQTGISFSYISDNIEQYLFSMCKSEGVANTLLYSANAYSRNLLINSFLKSITESTEYITAAYLIDESNGEVYDYIRSSAYSKRSDFMEKYNEGLFDSAGDIKWFSDEQGNIYLRRAFYNFYPYKRVGSVIIDVARNKLMSMAGFNEAETGFYCIFDSHDDLVINGCSNVDQTELICMAYDECIKAPNTLASLEYDAEIYNCYVYTREDLGWNVLYIIAYQDKMAAYYATKSSIWMVGLCLCVGSVLLSFLLSMSLTRRISYMTRQLKRIGDGTKKERLVISGKDEIHDLAESFNQMLDKLTEAYQSVIDHQIQEDKVRYELLDLQVRSVQARIAPHFISNLLSALSAYAAIGETDRVEQLAVHASRYLRQNIESYDRFFSTVEEEFHTIDDYVYLYQSVFGQPKQYTKAFETEDVKSVMMPCLLLQPLVENSLKYYRSEDGLDETQIGLMARMVEGKLQLVLEDTSGPVPQDVLDAIEGLRNHGVDSAQRLGFGLSGIVKRLNYMYNGDFEFQIYNSPNRHKRIVITIPAEVQNFCAQLEKDALP